MDVTTQRRFLGAIAGGLMVGAAATVAWSLSGIDQQSVARESQSGREASATIASDGDASAFDDRIAAQRLRRPLYDPPPAPRARPPKPPAPVLAPKPRAEPKLDVTLVGTIIEAEQSLAILADSTGKFDVKGVGEALELSTEGITVQNIESEQVVVQFQGRRSTLTLDRSDRAGRESGTREKEKKRRREK